MMKKWICKCAVLLEMCFLLSCRTDVKIAVRSEIPSPLVEAYADMTIPCNIAPLNFFVESADGQEALVLTSGDKTLSAVCKDGAVIPDLDEWKDLLAEAGGKSLQVEHCVLTAEGWKAFQPFVINVSEDPIDPYLVYRLIPPGYEMWSEMGIYQRNLENFEETAVIANRQTGRNCVNCHSFCMQNPDQMMFHSRARHAGTMLINKGTITKLDTKTEQTISALVYPHWHPSGKYIAYSVNDTKQLFHTNHRNRIEVMDLASDVVVYDVERNELVTASQIFDKDVFETFPAFSPDGKTLYYCAARKQAMPDDVEKLRYHLCAIAFDAETRTFGEKVDTLYQAEMNDRSISFPRVSPDGRHLMVTLADNATFPIWHQEADLWMIDLKTKAVSCLDNLNSESVESYHSWSSNSRWVVFSSRRMDGLYTRPYIAYIDEEGKPGKPFVVPQKKGDFYTTFLYSYNIPELVKGRIEVSHRELIDKMLSDEQQKVSSRI